MAILLIPFVTGGEIIYSFHVGSWNISLTSSGMELMGTLLAKAWLSVICIAVFMYATRIYDFLKDWKDWDVRGCWLCCLVLCIDIYLLSMMKPPG